MLQHNMFLLYFQNNKEKWCNEKMKPTLIKAVSAAVLTSTLLVSSYTPFTSQQVSAKTASDVKKDVQVTMQIKTIRQHINYHQAPMLKNQIL